MKIIYCSLVLCLFVFAGCKDKTDNDSIMSNETEIDQASEKSEALAYLLSMIDEEEIDRVNGYIGRRQAFPPSDYIPVEIEIYELKAKYYPMFDSIILRSISHPGSWTRKLGFSVSVSNEDTEFFGRIRVEIVNHWSLDAYGFGDAVFYYKGFQFNYDGDFFGDMVRKKEVRTLYRVNPDLFLFAGIDDSYYYGSWSFLIENGKVIFEDSFMRKKWN